MPPFIDHKTKEMLLMAKKRPTKVEMEIVTQREDRLDNILFECLEIMKRPEKWAIDRQGNFVNVYPHPIVYREAHKIEGVEYLPHKSYKLPAVLLERLVYWEDLTKGETKVKGKRGYKQQTGSRKPYTRVTPAMVTEIVTLRGQGLSLSLIGEQVGVSEYTVNRYLKAQEVEAI